MNTGPTKRFSRCHRAAPPWGMSNVPWPILYQRERLLLPREVGKGTLQQEFLQGNLPSRLCSQLGSTGEWMGWAAEMGQWRRVNNNRVWVMCAVRPDLPCSLSCSHPEAISRTKLWAGRGEFLSNYENVYGKGIFIPRHAKTQKILTTFPGLLLSIKNN